ncbi:hypothetical protein ACNS7O_02260 [Haloferacaceae archaeon DSL9]
MAVEQPTVDRHESQAEHGTDLRYGAALMALAGIGFVGYGVVFLVLAFFGSGFEIGVATLDGLTRAELAAGYPEAAHYITHLHVATAAFIIATGLAVASLAWYGVRTGQRWAWTTAVAAPVIALGLALPMHYTDGFAHNWVTHLGPIYLATLVFVVGALLALRGMRTVSSAPGSA